MLGTKAKNDSKFKFSIFFLLLSQARNNHQVCISDAMQLKTFTKLSSISPMIKCNTRFDFPYKIMFC